MLWLGGSRDKGGGVRTNGNGNGGRLDRVIEGVGDGEERGVIGAGCGEGVRLPHARGCAHAGAGLVLERCRRGGRRRERRRLGGRVHRGPPPHRLNRQSCRACVHGARTMSLHQRGSLLPSWWANRCLLSAGGGGAVSPSRLPSTAGRRWLRLRGGGRLAEADAGVRGLGGEWRERVVLAPVAGGAACTSGGGGPVLAIVPPGGWEQPVLPLLLLSLLTRGGALTGACLLSLAREGGRGTCMLLLLLLA